MRQVRFDPLPYIVALLAVAAALGVGLYVRPLFGIENVDLIFLTAIVGIAVRYGLWPSLAASGAASLAYNFFFLPPLYTFTITDPDQRRRLRLVCRAQLSSSPIWRHAAACRR